MISDKVIRSCIEELKDISGVGLSCFDPEGREVYSTDGKTCIEPEIIKSFLNGEEDNSCFKGHRLFRVIYGGRTVLIAASAGKGEKAGLMGRALASELAHLCAAYGGKQGRDAFLQDLLTNNAGSADIYNRAKEYRIKSDRRRAVFIVERKNEDGGDLITDVVRGIFGNDSEDYVTAIDEKKTIIIKELKRGDERDRLKAIAAMIADTVNAEAMLDVRVSCGGAVNELKDIARSFMEASLAMDVGKIFYNTENIAIYSELGVGRLIHQLPEELCVNFLHEIYGEKIPEKLDDEMLLTISRFLENSLNVSETARQLFVHRSTLLHRLEKIERTTGLDIRVFEDALTLKISLMVMDHMRNLNSKKEA